MAAICDDADCMFGIAVLRRRVAGEVEVVAGKPE